MKKNWFFLLAVTLIFAACSGEEKSDKKKEGQKEENKEEVADSQETGPLKQRIDDYVFSQDTSFESYTNKSSLPFLNNKDQIELQSFFHYNADGVLKVVEEYQNTAQGQDIRRWYYKDDQVVCLSDIHVDYQNEENWRQKKFYFENGELQMVDEFKELDGEGTTIEFSGDVPTTDNAVNMLELNGDFALTFSGFIEQPAGAFIVVKAQRDGFTSALVVDQGGADDFVKDLYDNQKNYLGKKIKVQWESVVDPSNGLKQNAYRGGAFVE